MLYECNIMYNLLLVGEHASEKAKQIQGDIIGFSTFRQK